MACGLVLFGVVGEHAVLADLHKTVDSDTQWLRFESRAHERDGDGLEDLVPKVVLWEKGAVSRGRLRLARDDSRRAPSSWCSLCGVGGREPASRRVSRGRARFPLSRMVLMQLYERDRREHVSTGTRSGGLQEHGLLHAATQNRVESVFALKA